ncbi:GDSL-type esterase/lipase family protein [Pseudosporangium ferrugineum]|uniref:GDSL-like lipase/acylhydrolase family protein n=1 Tax=Pseudosporangium ferrugineum TaxID=439699 RepID=A0A2T0RSE5_9ACTN|nr:GDSL-type esterase/lipase family protein [Pseudosporangium ferrugineum]PRY24047.1 GDSL-like lipase/acylhydrolase family protein [Pseudosporangium ferrugineum]
MKYSASGGYQLLGQAAHAATHNLAGNDPISINQSQVQGLSEALNTIVRKPVYYLDVYNNFFTAANVWVTGQINGATTLTAQVLAGGTVLPVASALNFVVGSVLILNPGTANQQLVKVSAVNSNNLTIAPATSVTMAQNTEIAHLWSNSSHITADPYGSRAYGYWAANAQANGQYVFAGSGKKIVWLGDSWTAGILPGFKAALDARLGETTVVNAGVPGNTLAQMIARFATDVAPQTPDYVVVEHGVNDVYQSVDPALLAAQVDQVVALVQSIGAIAVFPGMVPLADYPVQSVARQVELKSQLSSPQLPATTMGIVAARFGFPGVNPGVASSLRFGGGAQPLATGANNIAIGQNSQVALTTGVNNVAVGQQAQNKITTPNFNVAIGQASQFNLFTGAANVAIGSNAQFSMTTGANNVAVGHNSQYSPAGTAANATTSGVGQTSLGYGTGQASTTAVNYITTIGYNSVAGGGGSYATALGAFTSATGWGSVAIGCDTSGAGASTNVTNEIALGTANHTTKIAGRLNTAASVTGKAGLNVPHGTAPTTPVDGDMWTTTAGLFVRINGATVGPLT